MHGNAALSGGGMYREDGAVLVTYCDAWDNTPDDYANMTDPTGANGNVAVDPLFVDVAPANPLDWDLHLALASPLIDAGDPALFDPDGSTSDMGAYGGSGASTWDLDRDGYDAWWQPGEYDHGLYPGQGLDCDDLDETVYPGNGC